jgi:lysozyme family protein
MTKSIAQLVDEVISREGAYSNHPADKGGPTKFGVTQQVARAYGYKGDMRELPRETAAAIYIARYWTRPGFHLVAERYEKVAEELFDTGINMGPGKAVEFLQRALNALNRGASDYPDMTVDNDIGPVTLHALDGYKNRRGSKGEAVLLKALDALQGARYIEITEGRPANEAFLYGWLANRVSL